MTSSNQREFTPEIGETVRITRADETQGGQETTTLEVPTDAVLLAVNVTDSGPDGEKRAPKNASVCVFDPKGTRFEPTATGDPAGRSSLLHANPMPGLWRIEVEYGGGASAEVSASFYKKGWFFPHATRLVTPAEQLKQDRKDDGRLLVIFGFVTVIGILSGLLPSQLAAWTAIVAVDAYLSVVLVLAALRTDHAPTFRENYSWIARWFPRRTAGFLLIVLLLASVVFGFAGLYIGTNVFREDKSWLDAIYIGFQTLGFSDFQPKAGHGQRVVIAELASGVLLLIGAFPLVISRMSTFEST